jgi:hypothetical protein
MTSLSDDVEEHAETGIVFGLGPVDSEENHIAF